MDGRGCPLWLHQGAAQGRLAPPSPLVCFSIIATSRTERSPTFCRGVMNALSCELVEAAGERGGRAQRAGGDGGCGLAAPCRPVRARSLVFVLLMESGPRAPVAPPPPRTRAGRTYFSIGTLEPQQNSCSSQRPSPTGQHAKVAVYCCPPLVRRRRRAAGPHCQSPDRGGSKVVDFETV